MSFVWLFFGLVIIAYFFKEGITSIVAFLPQKLESSKVDNPKISVVIPTRNEELIIERAISNWINIDYPHKKMEIIVSDNSQDKTEQIVKEISSRCEFVKYYRANSTSKLEAIEKGLHQAIHDFVFVCDADIFVDENCVNSALPYLENRQVGCVFGTRLPLYDNSFVKVMMGLRELFISVKLKFYSWLDSTPWISLSPGAFRKEDLLKALEDYDPKIIADDLYIAVRIRKNGKKVKYIPEMTAQTGVIGNFRDLWTQQFRGSQAVAQAIVRFYHRALFLPNIYGMIVVTFKFFTYVIGYTFLPLFLLFSLFYLRFDLLLFYYLIMLFFSLTNFASVKKIVDLKNKRLCLYLIVFPVAYTIVELVWAIGWYGWLLNRKPELNWTKTTSDRA